MAGFSRFFIDRPIFAAFLSIVITLAAALVSALIVRHQLDRLDLIGVLKSKE